MTSVAQANQAISELIESWCDRRELGPLRLLLQRYPLVSNLTDEWGELATALKAVRVHHGCDLPAHELDAVVELHQLAESIVYR